MYKLLIIITIISLPLQAQTSVEELKTDSVTYGLYMKGDWKQLIEAGKIAEKKNIDFKYLQQRLGFANFMLGDYYKTIKHYQKALKFDSNDQISQLYLYYAANNIGDYEMAGYHASKLLPETRRYLNVKSFKLLDAVDLEYNYKLNGTNSDPTITTSDLRSNPNYYRFGLNSKLSTRLNVYQSASHYNQVNDLTTQIQQNEYFLLLTYGLFSRTTARLGFHHLNTTILDNTYNYSDTLATNVFIGSLTQRTGRFDFGISASLSTGDTLQTKTGLHVGLVLPGRFKPYLKSTLYNITRNGSNRLIFTQSAGVLATSKLWLEADIALGNLENFVDNNGLYVYNSVDPTKFRTGISAFWYVLPKLTFFTNYTFDKKNIISNQTNYNQHSFSGGLIWKL